MMLLASHLFWICCHIAKITSLLRHVKAVYRQTDPSVCVHVLLQCICRPYLTVTFDLYLYAAYRNAQGSVDEDPVALLQASHTAAKPSQVWCALLLPHMQLIPSSPCFHRVLCCAVNSPPLACDVAVLYCDFTHRRDDDFIIWVASFTPFCLFCCYCVFPFPITCLPSSCSFSCGNSWHLGKQDYNRTPRSHFFFFDISLVLNLSHVTAIPRGCGAPWECETFQVHFFPLAWLLIWSASHLELAGTFLMWVWKYWRFR